MMTTEQQAHKRRLSDAICMNHAYLEATRSKCARGNVGAVATDWTGRILCSGYNGTAAGEENCCDHFAALGRQPTRDEHRPWSDQHEIHAELNLVIFSARNGIRLEGCTVYCTKQPCWQCLKALGQLGITRLVYDSLHSRNSESVDEWDAYARRRIPQVDRMPTGWQHAQHRPASVPLPDPARYVSSCVPAEGRRMGLPVIWTPLVDGAAHAPVAIEVKVNGEYREFTVSADDPTVIRLVDSILTPRKNG